MKKQISLFEKIAIYFPVIILLFTALKSAYEKYMEIKAANEQKPVNEPE